MTRRRRWGRWALRLVLVVIAARLLLGVFLTQLLGLAAGAAGISLRMRTASLSLTGMSLRLQDFVAADAARPGSSPLLTAQDLELDLSMRHLLAGDLVVVDAALAGARLHLHRGPDGRWNVPAAWTEPAAAAPGEDEPQPVSFHLPVRVISGRVHDLQVVLDDESVRPARREQLVLDVDVREVGDGQTGELTARVHAPQWFDGAWLQARVRGGAERGELAWEATVRGLRPAVLPDVLPAGAGATWPDVRSLDATLRGQVTGEVSARSAVAAHYTANVRLAVEAAGQELFGVVVAAGPTSVAGAVTTVPFAFELAANDVVARCACTEGQAQLGGRTTELKARLAFEQATLRPLQPLLAAAGVVLPPDGVHASGAFAVELGETLSARVHDLDVRGGGERLRLQRAAVHGLRAGDDGVVIGAIDAVGPEAVVRLGTNGALHVAGVQLGAAAAGAAAPAPAATAAPAVPRVRIDVLAWSGAALELVDERPEPDARLRVDDLRVQGERLASGAAEAPGALVLTARAPGIADSLRIEATTLPRDDAFAADVRVAANGLRGEAAAGWLAPLGIAPALRDGSLALQAAIVAAPSASGTALEARLANVALRDGDTDLLTVRAITATGVHLGAGRIHTGRWEIEAPRATVALHGDGTVEAAGLRFGTAPAAAGAPPAAAPAPPPPSARTAAEASPALQLGSFALVDGQVRVVRADAAPVVVAVAASLGGAGPDVALPFAVEVALEGAPARVAVRGRVDPAASEVRATVAASGLRADELQPLLPPGVRCTLADGELAASVHAQGGASPSLSIDGLRLADRGAEIAVVERAVLALREWTPDLVHVAELTVAGARTAIATGAEGTMLPGVLLVPARANAAAAPAAAPADATSGGGVRLPLLAVDRLAVDAGIALRSGSGDELLLRATLAMAPWRATAGGEPGPPARVQLTASAMPLCAHLQVDAELQPYAIEPTVDATIAATGLDLTALTRVWPRLEGELEGTVANAELTASLHARLDLGRRDARLIELTQPLAGELVLEHAVLRDATADTTLAAIGSLDVTARAIDPRTGDVLLRSVDVEDVVLDAVRTADGVELLGLRLVTPDAPPPPLLGPPAPAARASAAAAPELAVDRFHVAGLRLGLGDLTTAPPTLLPIADGEIEVHRFGTRLFTEPRSFAFSFSLRGGDVALARRELQSSLLGGVLETAKGVVGAGSDEVEQRALFDEIAASGQLQFVPWLSGRIRATVAALELPGLRGLVEQGGVRVDDGLLDQTVTIEFRGPDGVDVRSNQTAQYLSLTDGEGGALANALGLGMPLATALFLLRNDAGEHRLPVSMHIPAKGLSRGAVLDLAAESFARTIGAAVSGAATRTLSGFPGLFFGAEAEPPVVVAVPFAAGDPTPGAELERVRAELAGDDRIEVVLVHELGLADLERARTLATPPGDVVAGQVARLRARHRELLAAREPLAEGLGALYAAGRMQAARERQLDLLQHDHATGELEQSLDRLLRILAGDDPRAQRRRTAEAAKALGEARLDAMRAELLRTVPDLDAQRIVARPARGVPTGELPGGGRVVATMRPLSVRELEARRPGEPRPERDQITPPSLADPAGPMPPLDPVLPVRPFPR